MLCAIINNIKTKTLSHLYMDNNGISGYEYYNGQKTNIKKDILKDIFSLFSINPSSKYIHNDNEYAVYVDAETGYKHYIKHGKEDFIKYFQENGTSSVRLMASYDDTSNTKTFRFKDTVISTTLALAVLLSSSAFLKLTAVPLATDTSEIYFSRVESAYERNMTTAEALAALSVMDAPEEFKECLMNKELFNDILPYYEGTPMQSLFREIMDSLEIRYYDNAPFEEEVFSTGYVDPSEPSVINLRRMFADTAILQHEFSHIMQQDPNEFLYLDEGMADIIGYEYFGQNPSSTYKQATDNVRLLTEIVGKDAMLKATYGNDSSILINTMNEYLTAEQAQRMTEILCEGPAYHDSEERYSLDSEMTNLIHTIYRNKYGEEMTSNPEIYNDYGNQRTKVYFNTKKYTQTLDNYTAFINNIVTMNTTYYDKHGNEIEVTENDLKTGNVPDGFYSETEFLPDYSNVVMNNDGTVTVTYNQQNEKTRQQDLDAMFEEEKQTTEVSTKVM